MDLNPDKHVKDMIKNVNLLDALHLLSEAWDDVKEKTIVNCFKHGGFESNQNNIPREEFDALDDVPIPSNMSEKEFCKMVDQDK